MDAGINNVIYMELYSGPKMANGICGKTIDTGTIDRGSTVNGQSNIPMFYSVATCSGVEINHHQARYSHSKAGKNAK
jgi:hypothetical protein